MGEGELVTPAGGIVSGMGDLSHLVAEAATSSAEQAEGIGRIDAQVGRMEEGIQANAVNAQESAEAGSQLRAQARDLEEMVGDLQAMIR